MTEPKQDNTGLGDAAKWLAGSLPIAVAALTFAGISGTELSRVIRVSPVGYVIGVVALFVAACTGVVALYVPTRARVLLTTGVLAFALGAGTLVTSYAVAGSKQDRPTISAGFARDADGLVAKIALQAAGLRPDQYVFVAVQGQNSQRRLDEQSAAFSTDRSPIPDREFSKQRIYSGRIGASPSGEADSTFELPLAESLYEQYVVQAAILDGSTGETVEAEVMSRSRTTGEFLCGPDTSAISCVTVLLPSPPAAR